MVNINLQCPINKLGYGIAGLNIFKSLSKIANVALHVIGNPSVGSQEDANLVQAGMTKAQTFNHKAPCIKIWHQNQMAERIGSGKFIGFPIFELDTFSDLEKHHLSSCDELMVCSQWAKSIVMDQCPPLKYEAYGLGAKPSEAIGKPDGSRVHVVPLGVDTNIFRPAIPTAANGKTIFFNCGKWEVRKGHDVLLEAFELTLLHHDNIELWMMCENPFNSPTEEAKWKRLYSHPKVKLIPRAETQQEVYNIMSQIDCGIFPSRGEGWNLELLEMMAAGKPVIATNYSAHTEFCNKDNCRLIEIQDTEPALDGKWFFGQGNWAALGPDQIVDISMAMRDFIDNGQRFNHAGLETAKQYSWDNTADAILNKLREDAI